MAATVSKQSEPIGNAAQVLKHELDLLAGTEDVSVLIDLIESRPKLRKAGEIRRILNRVGELRKIVDRRLNERMLEAVSRELTEDVMQWYDQVRTEGDPDVHFAGFDLERTKQGDVRPRRIEIGARSYGKKLVSAVSSLSESKLNALGLCTSLAVNIRSTSPFGFLIVDDPIQSMDSEHSSRFVDLIRALCDRGKQIIVLSHNRSWVQEVRGGCQSLNGWYYELTGYSLAGPQIQEVAWVEWKRRLDTVDAILKDLRADSVRLQQGEQEIRHVVTQLTAEIYRRKNGRGISANALNAKDVRKRLIECGVPLGLVDKVEQAYVSPCYSRRDDEKG